MVLGGAEDFAYLHPGPDRIASPVMGFLKNFEEALGGWLRPAVDEGAAPVAPVAVYDRTTVELDEVALCQASVALGVDTDAHPGSNPRKDPMVRVVRVAGCFDGRPGHAHSVAVAYVGRVHARFQVLYHEAHPGLGEFGRQPEPLDLE